MFLPAKGGGGGKSRAKRDFTIAWSMFGDTDRVTPNYRGSHQIPSCGGPQGRNPHLLRISTYFAWGLNPFEARWRGEPRRSWTASTRVVSSHFIRCLCRW